MEIKPDDYVEYTASLCERGFMCDVKARVMSVDRHSGLAVVRPYAVFAYHPEAREEGRWLPPHNADAVEIDRLTLVKQ